MMLYPAMKDLLKEVPSRYELVNVVACRARRIGGEAELEGEPLQEKPVSIAIQEVADGKLEASPVQKAEETAEAVGQLEGETAPAGGPEDGQE